MGRSDFIFSRIIHYFFVTGCMLPRLDEIHIFQALKMKENYYYIVTCRVTPSPKLLSHSRRSKLITQFRTLTNTGLYCLGFRASFLTHKRSTEQFSTSVAFFGAQNLIGWAVEITGQLLWRVSFIEPNQVNQLTNQPPASLPEMMWLPLIFLFWSYLSHFKSNFEFSQPK